MAGSVNILIPTDSMTLTDQRSFRHAAIIAGYLRAIEKKIGNADDRETVEALAKNPGGPLPNSMDAREFQNVLDAVTVLDQWNTAALAVVGTAVSVFQAVGAPVNAADKVVVFYKVAIETIPNPVSRILFRTGGIAGNIKAVYDLEQLGLHTPIEGFFSEPPVIDPTETYAVQVLPRIATGLLARVVLGAIVIEPKGKTVA